MKEATSTYNNFAANIKIYTKLSSIVLYIITKRTSKITLKELSVDLQN